MSTDTAQDGLLSAGRVGRAHGLDGSFYVTRPRPGVLGVDLTVRLAGRQARVLRCAGTADKPIVAVSGVSGRSAADALRGEDLWVTRDAVPAPGPDEWLAEDLEGCAVTDGETPVGTVKGMMGLPSCEVLEVERAEGGSDLLVPMVSDAIRTIDVAAQRIDIDLAFLGEAG